jgi:prepilin-type N-terminal cleavage/methylation domain-containing protein
MPRLSGPRAGFTLIELMVVIAIIGLMSGVALVSWEAMFPNQRFNTSVRRLSDVLHATRSEAIARSREFRIYYHIDDDSYAVRTPYRHGGGFARSDEDEDRVWVDQVNLYAEGIDITEITIDDVTYQEGEVYVRFDPLGASSYHTISLRQETFGREFTIEALPLTGDIRFHDGIFEREPAVEEDFE